MPIGPSAWLIAWSLAPLSGEAAAAQEPLVVRADITLARAATLDTPLVIAADDVTIDGNGATLRGNGTPGDLAALHGIGVSLQGRRRVTIRNLKVHGFDIGLKADDCTELTIERCDFSDNDHDRDHGWGDGPRHGGVILTRVSRSRVAGNRANHVWNGIDLWECDDNEIVDNDFSRCSNVCLKLWRSSRNHVADNDLSWGLRIRAGEVHARDSTSVLIETGSDDNRFERNDCTHGGDGIFIRVLNGWISTRNVFIENDCSYANNNGVESWSPGNVFLRNKANHCSYGFWLGGSDATVLIGNEAAFNGCADGFHNAPEPDFRHGGIVIVNGSGSHTLIADNHCHHNNGGGIVFRGDLATRGAKWRMRHLVIQGNRIEHNQWGIFARFSDHVVLAGNAFAGNEQDEHFEEVTHVLRGADTDSVAPVVEIDGPARVMVGARATYTARVVPPATAQRAAALTFAWDVGEQRMDGAQVTRTFEQPGFHRVSLTAHDGHRAGLAYLDVYALPEREDAATEGGAARFRATQGGDAHGHGRVAIRDDDEAIIGRASIRVRPDPYAGGEVVVALGADPAWDLSRHRAVSFWLRFRNPNFGFAGPTIVRLHAGQALFTYVAQDRGRPRNLLGDVPDPEARAAWQRVEIPLQGDAQWLRSEGFAGAVPAHFDRDLEFVTLATGVATQDASAMASDGRTLYLASIEGDRVLRSEDGVAWRDLPSPRAALGAPGDWTSGMLVFHGGSGKQGCLLLRHRDAVRDEHDVAWSRLVRCDLATGAWSWLPARLAAGHGSTVVGDHLFALAHALGANYGGAIERVDLAQPGAPAQRSAHARLPGRDPWWLSRAAQLATLGGLVYAIKNDWTTPRPEDPEQCGDRLFAFAPQDFAASTHHGGHPWREDQWQAAYTPVRDLGALPFEIGHGAALVALPPRWCAAIGAQGGLFIVAGCSPSDHEGQGPPSASYALYDIQSGAFTRGALPATTGTGTSAVFHDGRVFVKRGGQNFAAFNEQLWVVRPVDPTHAARGREHAEATRMDLRRVDRISLQVAANGRMPFDLWIDGLRFED